MKGNLIISNKILHTLILSPNKLISRCVSKEKMNKNTKKKIIQEGFIDGTICNNKNNQNNTKPKMLETT